jgi:hypothetical protein
MWPVLGRQVNEVARCDENRNRRRHEEAWSVFYECQSEYRKPRSASRQCKPCNPDAEWNQWLLHALFAIPFSKAAPHSLHTGPMPPPGAIWYPHAGQRCPRMRMNRRILPVPNHNIQTNAA